MARTIAEIQQSIIDAKNASPELAALTSTSSVAIWLLWTWVVATAMWLHENIFDQHKSEVAEIIAKQKPHTLQWYVTKALAFQYGDSLPAGSDTYATIDPEAQVVKFAAAVELSNLVRIKVAGSTAGVLEALSAPKLTSLTAYILRVKDAGVRIQVTSGTPDNLKVSLLVYYDPLVLASDGSRIDGAAATPVKDAINSYLGALPFNGVFVLNNMIAAIQAVSGVVIGEVDLCQANYGALPYVTIAASYTPDSGYMRLNDAWFDAHVTYTAS